MSVIASPPVLSDIPEDAGAHPRRWTREEYYRAAEAGIFRPEERLELIEGEVIEKVSPQGTPHATAIRAVTEALENAFGEGFDVRSQLPLTIPAAVPEAEDSEPEPDVLVVAGSWRDYRHRHPGPADVRLAVEISDTTLSYDRHRKAPLFARAGIPEYWIVNLPERRLEVYRDPQNGVYQTTQNLGEQDAVTPVFAARTSITVADLLP